tara:strand:- start:80 stop:619 length:540 start_codon:yes stop_codon:yes gene_type:complete
MKVRKQYTMLTKIDTNIPKNTNLNIINNLCSSKGWYFGFDENNFMSKDQKDAGLLTVTFKEEGQYYSNDILNTYAQIVFDMVEKNSFMKFKKINRIYWNWYHPGSIMQFHMDNHEDNRFSIIYNLHDSDGGTEFKIDNQVKFYKSIESQAILFPSKIYHRGIAPKTNPNRFSLNIMLEI